MAKLYKSDKKEDLEEFINNVANCILSNNMCLFIGAGSSMQYGAMSWNELIEKVTNSNSCLDNLQKAEYDNLINNNTKHKIAKELELENISSKKHTYLNYLLDFDFSTIWTTNYDSVIEQTLKEKSKKCFPIYQFDHFKQLSYPKGICLFKINGSFQSHNSIVITKDDFIDYKRTHEGFLILLKRELLCNNFLFLGCSFEDDILRMNIKDIMNCIDNSGSKNFLTEHYAIIAEENVEKLDYILKDMSIHYNINCLSVKNTRNAYLISKGIAEKVKLTSIFVSGSKKFERHTTEEKNAIIICRNLVKSFVGINNYPYKLISGMGMSIGNFISGSIKQIDKIANINRCLDMQPFPFTNANESMVHRYNIMRKAGIFIFIYGDKPQNDIANSGMWKEYLIAKKELKGIIIALPCGADSISSKIYNDELKNEKSFSYTYKNIIDKFDYKKDNSLFFEELFEKVNLVVREKMDKTLKNIINDINL